MEKMQDIAVFAFEMEDRNMAEFDREIARIAVLAGGSSSESDISLASGANVVEALKEAGFGHVELMNPASEGFLRNMEEGRYDAAFIAMHGAGGEDGKIQSVMEFLGIPYTGSGVTASACAADKDISKLLYARAGIPIAPGVTIERGDDIDIDAIVQVVGEKSFVKPAVNGSSYGITYVKRAEDLMAAIEYAFTFDNKVLIEKKVEGVEITVGVYGADEVEALPIVEILKQEDAEFFDLRVKYISPDKIHRIPAQISNEDYVCAQELACRAHEALGCFGLSRSDFIVSADGPVILETNTIPGMTDTSLFPDEIRHTDHLAFPEVCASLIEMAVKRNEL